jgi:hypothetical protein
MKLHHLTILLLIPLTYAYPVPYTTSNTATQSTASPSDNQELVPSLSHRLTNLAFNTLSTTLILLAGISLSEWVLQFYSHLTHQSLDLKQTCLSADDMHRHREEDWLRRERTLDLLLQMAANYSAQVAAQEGFDGRWRRLKVPGSVVEAVETVIGETGDDGELERLKAALRPLLGFEREKY